MSDSEKPKSSWWEIITNCCVSIDRKCKPTERRFDQCAILKILGYAGRFTVLVAVIFYIKGCPERRMQSANLRMQVKHLESQLENQLKSQHYQAWQVINAAQGKTGSDGRIDALQDLHRDGISLAGVDISKANLPNLNLENADLSDANLAEVNLYYANLTRAELRDANLTEADFWNANLTEANLRDANLIGAKLRDVDLTGASLYYANLTGADLSYADLTEANLTNTNLAEVNLMNTNLTRANLMNIRNWQDIKSIEQAMIYDVNNPPDGFIGWAKEHGAVLIEDDEEWKRLLQEQTKEK
jgi:uncharacterized protein YjbI with pentapeptide repeats